MPDTWFDLEEWNAQINSTRSISLSTRSMAIHNWLSSVFIIISISATIDQRTIFSVSSRLISKGGAEAGCTFIRRVLPCNECVPEWVQEGFLKDFETRIGADTRLQYPHCQRSSLILVRL